MPNLSLHQPGPAFDKANDHNLDLFQVNALIAIKVKQVENNWKIRTEGYLTPDLIVEIGVGHDGHHTEQFVKGLLAFFRLFRVEIFDYFEDWFMIYGEGRSALVPVGVSPFALGVRRVRVFEDAEVVVDSGDDGLREGLPVGVRFAEAEELSKFISIEKDIQFLLFVLIEDHFEVLQCPYSCQKAGYLTVLKKSEMLVDSLVDADILLEGETLLYALLSFIDNRSHILK